MPTEKPRVTITMSKEELGKIDDFRFSKKMKNQTQAILTLVKCGLDELDRQSGTAGSKKVPSVSDGALQVAKDYDALDSHGRRIVRDVIVAEQDRMAEEAKIIEFDPEKKKRECTVFLEPSAAGKAAPTFGEDFDIMEVPDDAPQGIEFGVRVKGDSMQPYYKDGQTVYVNHDPLKDGEVGIFCVDGGTVIKQYHHDKMLGITYLFSLNRSRADCDVVITPNSDRQLVFQGRVLGTHVFPLPGADE